MVTKTKDSDSFPAIAIDSREQNPFRFPSYILTEVRTLRTGDYSLVGFEDRVAIERKSKQDAYGTIGSGRGRFTRELERLHALDYGAIVVESSLPDFLAQPPFSGLHPHAAVNSLIAWSIRYRVPVHWSGDRRHATALVLSLLRFWWKYRDGTAQTKTESEEEGLESA